MYFSSSLNSSPPAFYFPTAPCFPAMSSQLIAAAIATVTFFAVPPPVEDQAPCLGTRPVPALYNSSVSGVLLDFMV